jgi:glutamine synthetase
MSETIELKPCPFCGGKAQKDSQKIMGELMEWVLCTECGAATDLTIWNTRTDDWHPVEIAPKNKLEKVLQAITPICKAFGITDFDYTIENGQERLHLGQIEIGCTSNSINAIIDEVIGYVFVTRYCFNRSIGAFQGQVMKNIKRYWMDKNE